MAAAKKPVMDVSKPGKTPANATARPIIVNHGPAISDPMVTPESAPNASEVVATEEPQALSAPSSAHKVIAPIVDKTDETPTESAQPPVTVATEDKPETEPQPDVTEEQAEDETVVDPASEQRATEKQKEEKLVEQELKRQELVDTLVTQKKYFLPIGSTKQKRNNRIAFVLLLALLPLVIGVVLAIDAEVIDPGFTLPFDLIK